MTLDVKLTDALGKPVCLSKSIPLTVRLCYDKTQQPVRNQDILTLMSHSRLAVGKNGCAQVNFRVDQVSRLHQLQKFCLRIAPDVEQCPLNGDILPVYSSGVTVRSKRSSVHKRRRKGNYPKPGIAPQIGQSLKEAMQASKRARLDAGGTRQAIQNLIGFCTRTHDMLRDFQCQHVGYELNSDGSPNLALKINRCPSCYQTSSGSPLKHAADCTINQMLATYARYTGPGISRIMKSVAAGVCPFERSRSVVRSSLHDQRPRPPT